ncbi:hypothetical protein [Vitreimonas sp.]|uniref:hypothetical protein n=1 Tax=Vitreimonas sp. TaxID=3069702 RepID=UPI002ED9C944
MSRVWYADILNWAKYASAANRIEIDFAYASGEYVGSYPTRAVSQTIALLGFEGRADPNVESVALFGLGYDPITPPSVLEDLQPDWKYAFVAGEGDDGGVARTLKLNKAILDELDGPPVILPLMSIQQSYRTVGEMVAPHVGLRNCIIVPLGPKSHVLASLLVASRSEAVSCLYVKGGLNEPIDVREGRSMTFCSVLFE